MQLQYFRTVSDDGIFCLESGDIHSGRAWVRVCAYEWMCVVAERNGEGEGLLGGCGQRENQMGFDGTKKISAKLPLPK